MSETGKRDAYACTYIGPRCFNIDSFLGVQINYYQEAPKCPV